MVNNSDAYTFELCTNGESIMELSKIQLKVFNQNGMNWRLCTPEEKEQYYQQQEGKTNGKD